MGTTKPFTIPKSLVMRAFKAVKANAGSAGIDKESIEDFAANLEDNLYKLWNRMSSGTYFPPPVKAVPIPKKNGGTRILGIPTVADRVGQMVVKMQFEPDIEPHFLADSYGYRPGKSAIDAIGITRKRCWQYNWVLEFDIKGLFDNIDHDLLMRAVKKHTECNWVILYIERWLRAPLQQADGTLVERTKGTPQGGVISPCLANLFLHYTFDVWMTRTFPNLPWCRYADDGLVHCNSEREAIAVKAALCARLAECGLEMHPDKTKIVYCKDSNRNGNHPETDFTFLGYTFSPKWVKNAKLNKMFMSFGPAVSNAAVKAMRQKTREIGFRNRTELSLEDISKRYNPVLRGWFEYYGKYQSSALAPVYRHFNATLVYWAMRKYRRLRGHKVRACKFIERVSKRQPKLFIHWTKGEFGVFA